MKVNIIRPAVFYAASIVAFNGAMSADIPLGFMAITYTGGTSEEIKSKDLISDGKPIVLGDRACNHVAIDGNLELISSNSVTTKVQPVLLASSAYHPVPATTMRPVHRYITPQGASSTGVVGPIGINDLRPMHLVYPDFVGTIRRYWDLSADFSRDPSGLYVLCCHYFDSNIATGKVTETTRYDRFEIDFPNRRYRRHTTSTWIAFKAIKVDPSFNPTLSLPTNWREYSRLIRTLRSNYAKLDTDYVYGDLVRRCANDAKVIQTNSIALLKEIREISDTVRLALNLLKGRVDLKKLSSAYLQYKYGLRLTINDINSIGASMNNLARRGKTSYAFSRSKEEIFSTRTTIQSDSEPPMRDIFTYKVTYRPYEQSMCRFFQLWIDSGLFPTLENVWDLVPLTFVVDWFTGINKHLDAIDTNTYWSTYDVVGATYSRKSTIPVDPRSIFLTEGTFIGDCTLSSYSRNVSHELHKPLFYDTTSHYFKNYAELTALIIANLR